MEKPIEMDDLGVPIFLETPILSRPKYVYKCKKTTSPFEGSLERNIWYAMVKIGYIYDKHNTEPLSVLCFGGETTPPKEGPFTPTIQQGSFGF